MVASQAESALGDAEVIVLPNGIDVPLWCLPERLPHMSQEIKLVSTMRLHRKKRPHQLLRIVSEAAARTRAKISIVIVGDGPERGALERAIRLRAVRNVELRGWQDMHALRKLYSSSDGFVVASAREAFGSVFRAPNPTCGVMTGAPC
jgi:glycosyltransferase involved in cell wall biosynthesis